MSASFLSVRIQCCTHAACWDVRAVVLQCTVLGLCLHGQRNANVPKMHVVSGAVRQQISLRVSQHINPSIAVAVVHASGEADVVCEGVKTMPVKYGEKRHVRERVSERTTFELGEISSVITGLLVADSVRRGEMNYHSTFRDIFGDEYDAVVRDVRGQELTVEHVATNTACLPLLQANTDNKNRNDPYAALGREDILRCLNMGTVMGGLARQQFGASHNYSNLGYELLGLAVQRASGERLEHLFEERLFKPLHMIDAQLGKGGRRPGATPHNGVTPVSPWTAEGEIGASFALHASLSDMKEFLAASLNPFSDSFALPASLVQALHDLRVPRLSARAPIGWQYLQARVPVLQEEVCSDEVEDGSQMREEDLAERTMMVQGGNTGGTRAFVGLSLEDGLGAVALTNGTASINDIALTMLGVPSLSPYGPRKIMALKEAESLAGTYCVEGEQAVAVSTFRIVPFNGTINGDDDVWLMLHCEPDIADPMCLVSQENAPDQYAAPSVGAVLSVLRHDNAVVGLRYMAMDGSVATYTRR